MGWCITWIDNEWLTILAIALSISFILASPLNTAAQFDDQVEELKKAGVQAAYNFYAEAGYGFAEHVCQSLDEHRKYGVEET